MANKNLLAEPLLESEGGYVDHPNDPGGPTNKGVTLATYKKFNFDNDRDGIITTNDLKLMSNDQWVQIFSSSYWRSEYDHLYQPLADMLVNNKWGSGISNKLIYTPIDQALSVPTSPVANISDLVEQQTYALIKMLATQWNFTRLMIQNPKFRVFRGWHVKALAWSFRFFSGHRFKLSTAMKLTMPAEIYIRRN